MRNETTFGHSRAQLGRGPSDMASIVCRVQYLEDSDPFICTNFPEPRRPPTVSLEENVPLIEQIAGIHKLLEAPLKVGHRLGLGLYWSVWQGFELRISLCPQV